MAFRGSFLLLLSILSVSGAGFPPGAAVAQPSSPPPEAYLWLCPATTVVGQATFRSDFWQPDGRLWSLIVSAGEPLVTSEPAVRLPFPAAQIVWAGLLPSVLAGQLEKGVILEGKPGQGGAEAGQVADVSPLVEKPAPGVPQPPPVARFPPKNLVRSGWIWQPSAWRDDPDGLFTKLELWNMRRVYISIPVNSAGVETPEKLGSFLEAANHRGVAVWGVEGDPYALLGDQQAGFVNRARAYAAYNATAPKSLRLAGLQYDIEPYLMPGYALRSSQWNEEYVRLLARLKEAAGMPLEIAVPFWFAGQTSGDGTFLDAIAPLVDSLVVMDYRTDEEEIRRFAQPFLRWGAEHGLAVHIALETVALPDAQLSIYRPARRGTLWLCCEQGSAPLLILLKTPSEEVAKGQLFAFSHTLVSPSSRTTFHGQEAKLRGQLAELESDLSQWSSFAGLAVHGTE